MGSALLETREEVTIEGRFRCGPGDDPSRKPMMLPFLPFSCTAAAGPRSLSASRVIVNPNSSSSVGILWVLCGATT